MDKTFWQLIVILLLLIVAVIVLVIIVNQNAIKDATPSSLDIGKEIETPEGYTLIDATGYGEFSGSFFYYCRQNDTDRIFLCNDGKIGKELIMPQGYVFVTVSSYGRFAPTFQFYCRQKTTGKVFVCTPQ